MASEERSHIDNGIWLCQSCSVLIDRDEARYTVEALKEIKRKHEDSRRIDPNRVEDGTIGDVLAVGPDIIGVGHIMGSGPAGLRVHLAHFVTGTVNDLITFASDFERVPAPHRYVLLNELGYGRTLRGAPEVTRTRGGYEVSLPLNPSEPRRDASSFGAGMCRHTGQLIRGMEVFVQHFETLLGLAIGDNVFHPRSGSRISRYYKDYAGSPWLIRLVKMEIVRLASIPIDDRLRKTSETPLLCVNRVHAVHIPSLELEGQCLPIRVRLDLEGLGYWEREVKVFIYNEEQLEAAARREVPALLKGIVD